MNMKSHRKILVVAAHPDDEILGCGATTAKHVAQGDRVWTLILGEGVTSRAGLSASGKKAELKKLRASARKANNLLGVERLILESFADNRFDTVARLDLVHAIESVISQFAPERIYTHSSCDLNVDHQLVCEAVRTACRPLPGSAVRRVLSFEVPSSTEWRLDPAHAFHPNIFIDVQGFLDKKLAALSAYRGEMRPFPHPRSEEYIRALSRTRGGQSGLLAAEAFCLMRSVDEA